MFAERQLPAWAATASKATDEYRRLNTGDSDHRPDLISLKISENGCPRSDAVGVACLGLG
jgi:hypothetical protein